MLLTQVRLLPAKIRTQQPMLNPRHGDEVGTHIYKDEAKLKLSRVCTADTRAHLPPNTEEEEGGKQCGFTCSQTLETCPLSLS